MTTEKNKIFWLLLSLAIGIHGQTQQKKRVCIIGGGMSGLVSAKQLTTNTSNIEPIVFEKGSDIGGQWRYTNSTDVDEHGLPVHSSIYENLRVNGPKTLMSFPDYQEFHGENRCYVRHEFVLDYLRNYTEHFNLRRFIKFDTLVEKVSLMSDKKWRMTTRNLNLNKSEVYECDAVMVCNGHFSKPNVPKIPGLETFPGRVLHSHMYRHPEEFANQTVVILGASMSGIDVGIGVSEYAKTIYLSHRHKKLPQDLPKNVIQVPGVVSVNGSDFILSNGSRLKADALLMCTGYLYDYPFLDKSSGITVTKGKYVHPLYKQFINIKNPTMGFVGLPYPSFPFYVPYVQANYFKSLLQGKAKLPIRLVMLIKSQLPLGRPVTKAHLMKREVLFYYNDLAKAAGIETLSKPLITAALTYVQDFDNNPMYFKDHDIVIRDDGSVELSRPNNSKMKIEPVSNILLEFPALLYAENFILNPTKFNDTEVIIKNDGGVDLIRSNNTKVKVSLTEFLLKKGIPGIFNIIKRTNSMPD